MKIAFLLPLLLLAACSGKGDAGSGDAAPAASVPAAPAPAGTSWVDTVVRTPEGGFRMGNPNAALKLVEYGARTCPTCGAFGREGMQPLEKGYVATGKVSYEFRDFLVHGAPDLSAALLGQCGGPATFFPILEQMYQNQEGYLTKLQQLSPAEQNRLNALAPAQAIAALGDAMGLVDFVKQRGVPEAKARACLADAGRQDALAKATQDAQASGTVTGTPTFLLNGRKVDALSWAQLEPELKRAGG